MKNIMTIKTILCSLIFAPSLMAMQTPPVSPVRPTQMPLGLASPQPQRVVNSPEESIVDDRVVSLIGQVQAGGAIYFDQLMFTNWQVRDALRVAHSRGVAIHGVVGSSPLNRDAVRRLAHFGIQIDQTRTVQIHSKRWLFDRVGENLDRIVVEGSANSSNLSKEHIELSVATNNDHEYFDSHLQGFLAIQNLVRTGGSISSYSRSHVDVTPIKKTAVSSLTHDLGATMIARIDNAQPAASIDLNFMNLDNQELTEAIRRAATQRQVQFRIFLNKVTDRKKQALSALLGLPSVSIYSYTGPKSGRFDTLLHQKSLVRVQASGKLALVTSGNGTSRMDSEVNHLSMYPNTHALSDAILAQNNELIRLCSLVAAAQKRERPASQPRSTKRRALEPKQLSKSADDHAGKVKL